MAAITARPVRRSWPIVYGQRTRAIAEPGLAFAWALFLVFGVPFAMMTVLTVLARGGIYIDLFRPLWQPWPPDLLKPFLGVAVFASTLAYLAYRHGRRRGYRAANVAASAARIRQESAPRMDPGAAVSNVAPPQYPTVPPPPPPEDDGGWEEL